MMTNVIKLSPLLTKQLLSHFERGLFCCTRMMDMWDKEIENNILTFIDMYGTLISSIEIYRYEVTV